MARENGDKKFNETIVPLWATEKGNYFSIEIGPEHYDALQKAEIGGKFFVKLVPEDRRKHEKSPYAYLEYVSKEDVAKFKANSNRNNGGTL